MHKIEQVHLRQGKDLFWPFVWQTHDLQRPSQPVTVNDAAVPSNRKHVLKMTKTEIHPLSTDARIADKGMSGENLNASNDQKLPVLNNETEQRDRSVSSVPRPTIAPSHNLLVPAITFQPYCFTYSRKENPVHQ